MEILTNQSLFATGMGCEGPELWGDFPLAFIPPQRKISPSVDSLSLIILIFVIVIFVPSLLNYGLLIMLYLVCILQNMHTKFIYTTGNNIIYTTYIIYYLFIL